MLVDNFLGEMAGLTYAVILQNCIFTMLLSI